jgi:hypothetical protein
MSSRIDASHITDADLDDLYAEVGRLTVDNQRLRRELAKSQASTTATLVATPAAVPSQEPLPGIQLGRGMVAVGFGAVQPDDITETGQLGPQWLTIYQAAAEIGTRPAARPQGPRDPRPPRRPVPLGQDAQDA